MKNSFRRLLCLAEPTLLWVAFFLSAPFALPAQGADLGSVSLDAWRAHLNERLDRDLGQLSASPPAQPASLLEVKRTGGNALNPETVPFPVPGIPSGAWSLPAVAAILREQGLPQELLGVAAVESGFNPVALSPDRRAHV